MRGIIGLGVSYLVLSVGVLVGWCETITFATSPAEDTTLHVLVDRLNTLRDPAMEAWTIATYGAMVCGAELRHVVQRERTRQAAVTTVQQDLERFDTGTRQEVLGAEVSKLPVADREQLLRDEILKLPREERKRIRDAIPDRDTEERPQ